MALVAGALMAAMLPGASLAAEGGKSECKNGGWKPLGFADQGSCVSYIVNGGTFTTLAIAYTNLDGVNGFGEGDQLIAKVVDTDGNGPDAGDRVIMGKYPLSLSAPFSFGNWGVKSHEVTTVVHSSGDYIDLRSANAAFNFYHLVFPGGTVEQYDERTNSHPYPRSTFRDFGLAGPAKDTFSVLTGAPSLPATPNDAEIELDRPTDDPFIDVDIFYTP
jgi:hypothetical protein